jgi:hypothetical protein
VVYKILHVWNKLIHCYNRVRTLASTAKNQKSGIHKVSKMLEMASMVVRKHIPEQQGDNRTAWVADIFFRILDPFPAVIYDDRIGVWFIALQT